MQQMSILQGLMPAEANNRIRIQTQKKRKLLQETMINCLFSIPVFCSLKQSTNWINFYTELIVASSIVLRPAAPQSHGLTY
jgi:hypothetical protein